jgi:hypothetical protein
MNSYVSTNMPRSPCVHSPEKLSIMAAYIRLQMHSSCYPFQSDAVFLSQCAATQCTVCVGFKTYDKS